MFDCWKSRNRPNSIANTRKQSSPNNYNSTSTKKYQENQNQSFESLDRNPNKNPNEETLSENPPTTLNCFQTEPSHYETDQESWYANPKSEHLNSKFTHVSQYNTSFVVPQQVRRPISLLETTDKQLITGRTLVVSMICCTVLILDSKQESKQVSYRPNQFIRLLLYYPYSFIEDLKSWLTWSSKSCDNICISFSITPPLV